MKEIFRIPVIAQGANAIYIKTGFCPDVVKVTEWATGLGVEWFRGQGNDTAITRVAAGDRTVQTAQGIQLVKMDGELPDLNAAPTVVEAGDWANANGFMFTSDLTGLTDHALLMVEAYALDTNFVRAVHDAGDAVNTYFQDSSLDFLEQGISGGQTYILLNITNQNYAHIGNVQRPFGEDKHCRLTLVDSGGAAMTAADIDDDDVCIIIQKNKAQYPLSDCVHMT